MQETTSEIMWTETTPEHSSQLQALNLNIMKQFRSQWLLCLNWGGTDKTAHKHRADLGSGIKWAATYTANSKYWKHMSHCILLLCVLVSCWGAATDKAHWQITLAVIAVIIRLIGSSVLCSAMTQFPRLTAFVGKEISQDHLGFKQACRHRLKTDKKINLHGWNIDSNLNLLKDEQPNEG